VLGYPALEARPLESALLGKRSGTYGGFSTLDRTARSTIRSADRVRNATAHLQVARPSDLFRRPSSTSPTFDATACRAGPTTSSTPAPE